MNATGPPPVKGYQSIELDIENASKAIEAVKQALRFMEPGPPIIHYGPRGEVHVDIPLMYHGYALDRIHYDPVNNRFNPKGAPGRFFNIRVDEKNVREKTRQLFKELRVIDAVEYREPENVWIVLLAWRNLIVAHVKVSSSGQEIIPDYHLTEEVRRHVL